MNQMQNLQFWDPARWLVGQTPAWFLVEVVLRAVLIYAMLQVVLRFMGRRVAAQMTISELAVIVTLGAAVGVPMQDPTRGMLAAGLILLIALGFQRGIGWATFRSRKAEVLAMGDVLVIVEDGRILLDVMQHIGLSRERLFSVLRISGLEHLGQVQRVYAEPSGDFSIYRTEKALPGLSVLPTFDDRLRNKDRCDTEHWACFSCGHVEKQSEMPTFECRHCRSTQWTEAVRSVRETSD
jgi:uncharacterized membrane protein YcaP (DUF421 family)